MYGRSRRKQCEEYQSMVKDKVAEAEWKYIGVNEHWQQMKKYGGMSKWLKQYGKRRNVWKLEKRKIDRGMDGVQEE